MAEPQDDDLLYAAAAVEHQLISPQKLAEIAAQADGRLLRQRLRDDGHLSVEQLDLVDQAVARKRAAAPADSPGDDGAPKGAGAEDDPFATRAYQTTPLPGIEQRYTLLRTHQQGGLGLISIARDEDFNREVVVKEILPAHADADQIRKRFIREAEITGALEHPGVVPVYSLGYHADGRPYYVMRFVHGVDMQQAIQAYQASPPRDKTLKFRQLLGRFVDVCNTIHYAHNRGVLHRDLKPSNIMLGDYGETIVVDWGLAKASGESGSVDECAEAPVPLSGVAPGDMTADGRVIGTPIFMSPEQAAGRTDQYGVPTDVYGLGATLYCLLTGCPPLDPSDPEILAKVRIGDIPSPRQKNLAAPKALSAVCMKAMAVNPGDRYATAGELGLEIERWMADQPVAAHRESPGARAWRWVRTHRAQVMSIGAAVLVGLVAMTVHVVRLSLANERILAAKTQADANLREAVAQRKLADRNAQLARDAVREYYVRVSAETLLNQPGMQPLRNDLLRQAMQYYQRFLDESADDNNLQNEVATAHYYIGKITQTIDGAEAAIPHLNQAVEAQRALAKAEDAPPTAIGDYARSLNALGSAYRALKRPDDAFELYEQARVLRQQIAEGAPQSADAARELANSFMNIGVLYAEHQQWETALEQMQRAQAIRNAHSDGSDTAPIALQRDLAKGSFNLAFIHMALGSATDARRELRDAVQQFERLRQAEPSDIATLSQLASSYRALGDLSAAQADAPGAVQEYRKAAELMTRLVIGNPEAPAFAVDLAGVRMNLGGLLKTVGDLEAALEEMLGAIDLLDVPAEQTPAPRQRRDLGVALREAGQLRVELDQAKEGIELLERSRDVLRRLVREHPGDPQFADDLAETQDAIRNAQDESEEPLEKAA